ncbi:hypothetical protein Trydic_g100 [Trypoxylus dichotomus]
MTVEDRRRNSVPVVASSIAADTVASPSSAAETAPVSWCCATGLAKRAIRKCLSVMRQKLTVNRKAVGNYSGGSLPLNTQPKLRESASTWPAAAAPVSDTCNPSADDDRRTRSLRVRTGRRSHATTTTQNSQTTSRQSQGRDACKPPSPPLPRPMFTCRVYVHYRSSKSGRYG